jgi:hypothetical protein
LFAYDLRVLYSPVDSRFRQFSCSGLHVANDGGLLGEALKGG